MLCVLLLSHSCVGSYSSGRCPTAVQEHAYRVGAVHEATRVLPVDMCIQCLLGAATDRATAEAPAASLLPLLIQDTMNQQQLKILLVVAHKWWDGSNSPCCAATCGARHSTTVGGVEIAKVGVCFHTYNLSNNSHVCTAATNSPVAACTTPVHPQHSVMLTLLRTLPRLNHTALLPNSVCHRHTNPLTTTYLATCTRAGTRNCRPLTCRTR